MNGLRSRLPQLRNYISQEQVGNSIFALCDTRLTDKVDVTDIKGYTLLRKDKIQQTSMATAGGVALLIPSTWACISINLKSCEDDSEALAAVLIPPGLNSRPIKVMIVYNHPGYHLPLGLLKEFKSITYNNSPVLGLMVGDFNSPHTAFGSRNINEFGSRLLQNINNENLVFFNNGEQTYLSNSTGMPNVLDLVLGEPVISPFVHSCYVSGDLGSDHYPLITALNWGIQNHPNSHEKINIQKWADKIDRILTPFQSTANIDENIQRFVTAVSKAKNESTTNIPLKKRYLPQEILSNIRLRKTILRNRKKATSEIARKVLTKQYNRMNKLVQEQIRHHDEQQVEKLANDISSASDTATMWKMFNNYKNKSKGLSEPESPLITPTGNFTANNKEKCDEFARFLTSVHQVPDNPIFDSNFKAEIDNLVNGFDKTAESGSITPINVTKLKHLLAETKTKSAPGEDEVSYALLKTCSDKVLDYVCQLFNQCLSLNMFPDAWKKAKVKMVLKPGRDKLQASSYRPISLVSALGKMYERHIYNHLLSELNNKKFFNKYQAGFVKGRSSHEHLFRLSQDISNGFKKRLCTLGVFLDVQSAFDCVWKNGIKCKIRKIGLSKQLENILFSFLDNRTLKVNYNGFWSEIVDLCAGTPQGACISPILYLIFVNDIIDCIDLAVISFSQYADDTGLWATKSSVYSAMNCIQAELRKLELWCRKWHVTLNPRKSKLILFTKCPRHKEEQSNHNLKLYLFGEEIPLVQEVSFLGATFDSRLTWEPNTKKIVSKAYKRLNLLRMISSLSTAPKPEMLLTLYKSTIRSIFEYGSICYINAAETHLEKIQSVQNQALRIVLNMPAYISIKDLHDASSINPIKVHLIDFAKRRFNAMVKCSPIINDSILAYEKVKNIRENASVLDIITGQ